MTDEKAAATVETQRLLSYLVSSIINPNSEQTWQGLQDLIYQAKLEEELKGDISLYMRLKSVYTQVNQVDDPAARAKILQSDADVLEFLRRLDATVMQPPTILGLYEISLKVWKALLGIPRINSAKVSTPQQVPIVPLGDTPSPLSSIVSPLQVPILPLGGTPTPEDDGMDEKSEPMTSFNSAPPSPINSNQNNFIRPVPFKKQ